MFSERYQSRFYGLFRPASPITGFLEWLSVCVCVCVCVCVWVSVYERLYECVCVSLGVYECVCLYEYVWVCVCLSVCECVCLIVCECGCMSVCVWTQMAELHVCPNKLGWPIPLKFKDVHAL
jgi:hypothetical protein